MLRRHFIVGASSALAAATLPQPACAETKTGRWMRLESPNFIYFSAGDEQKARDEVIALERYYAVLSKLVPRQQRSERKLIVYAVANAEDLKRTWPTIASDVAGFYDASVEHVKAVSAPFKAFERQRDMLRSVRAMDARVILFHEYAHHFMKANLQMAYPAWYGEGFAEFASTADLTDDGVWIGKFTNLRGMWLGMGNWLPIDKFLSGKDLSRDQNQMYYAQSWLAAHFLFTNPERAKGFDRYVVALSNGDDPETAFEPAFGITAEQFDKELRDYKRKKIAIYQLPETKVDHAKTITVARLPAAANELLAPMSLLRAVPLMESAKDTVAFVRTEAAKYPDDPFAVEALATTELWYGEADRARVLIDRLVAMNPKNAEAQHLSGLSYLRNAYAAGETETFKLARGRFAEAHRLDATRASSLFRYVECLTHIEDSFTEHMLDVSLEAYRLEPQVSVIKLLTAQALMQHKRWDEARLILRALMIAPHESDAGDRVRRLMDAAKAEKASPLIFYGAANTMESRPE